jgi:hypothetical protein
MPEDKSELFRGRVEIEGGGGFVKAQRPAKPEGLVVSPESFDLKKDYLDDFAGVAFVEPGDVDVAREPEGFTVKDVEVDALDDALRRIHWQQTDEEVRELTDEARQLLEAGDFPAALYILQLARDVAPTDDTVLYLIGLCHFLLDDFQTGYDELGVALEHIVDADTRNLAVMFRASCLRAIVNEIMTKLAELKTRSRFNEALALVEENLQQYPANLTLLYQRCELLLKLGLAEQAKRAAQEATERGGEENAPLFRRMFEQATLLEYRPLLEPARQALRADDPPWATKLLKSARSALKGQQFYEAVCTYAREKGRKPSGVLSLFSRSREQAAPIPDEQLQKLLRWLVAEELDVAHASFDRADYATAIAKLKQASYIDSRCSHVNYLLGLSLYRAFLVHLNNEEEGINLDRCARDLKDASRYVRDAATDPALADRSKELSAAIAGYYEQATRLLGELARHAEEVRAVNDLIGKYNSFMDRLEKTSIRTTNEWNSAREKIARFRQQAVTLRSGRSADQGGEILDRLVLAIDNTSQALDSIRDDVMKYSSIRECLIEHNDLIGELQKSRFMTEYQLRDSTMRVRKLLNKLAQARAALGYNAAGDSGENLQDALRNYVMNWTPGAEPGADTLRTGPTKVDPQIWDLCKKLEQSLRDNLRALESARRY